MPDSVPNYLTTNPDGTVGADFSGKISAEGVALLAGPINNLPPDSTVEWTDSGTANGGLIAAIGGGNDPGNIHELDLRATDVDGGFNDAAIQIASETGGVGVISAHVPGHAPTIIDSAGDSSFVQLTSAGQGGVSMIGGTINSAGVVGNGVGGNDFSVSHPSTGNYTVTVPNFVILVAVATPLVASGAVAIEITSHTAHSLTFLCFTTNTATTVNSGLEFIMFVK